MTDAEKYLREYRNLVKERKDLARRIRKKPNAQLEKFDKELERRLQKAEDYIQDVESSEIRQLLRYRYIDGLSWERVADQMGGGNSGDGCRMIVRRFWGS